MERSEAEAILDGDRATAVALLLRLDALVERNQRLVEANERLEARVAELERRLSRSSRNSSLPPSQDPPWAPPRQGGRGSGRKRGGQPGHEGRHRRLLPPERVDEVVEHWPGRCRACTRPFAGRELVDAAEPWRHQVAELPSIAVRVAEYRLHAVRCPACSSRTRAELPREVPGSAFGPRLQAAVVTLAVRNRVSRRDTTELARELFGVELATGSVDAIVRRAGEALASPHTRLEQQIKSAPVVNIDETGWKTAGGNRTLWGALTSQSAVFRIAAGRHGFEARTLLGERFAGIVCSDRWRGYDYLDPSQRQLCWAHLLRDFTAP
jgi:transposase